jgi:hypothetical protein
MGLAGRKNTEKRGDGDVRYMAHHHVLYHVGPTNPKGDILLIPELCYLLIFPYILILTLP